MGLCYHTSTWADDLWSRHCDSSVKARQLVDLGSDKQPTFVGFAEDIHARLYLRNTPETKPESADSAWATTLHQALGDLGEWRQLRQRCQARGFAAGLATEVMLETLMERIPAPPDASEGDGASGGPGSPSGNAAGDQAGNQAGNQDGNGTLSEAEQATLRQALRKATRHAQAAVTQADAELEGLQDALGLSAGKGPGVVETLQDMETIRQAYALLRSNRMLQQIAELAGRLQRMAQTHKRCKVSPAAGGITGVTLGGDLSRVLPSQLAGLRQGSRYLRLQVLARIQARQALQYDTQGEEPLGRGPVVLCLDESGSMWKHYVWSKAVALALLNTCTAQRRAWHAIGFSDGIRYEHTVEPGAATLQDVLDLLSYSTRGGTDFDLPLTRALEICRSTMQQADILFITDGVAPVSPEIADELQQAKQADSIHLTVVGIGHSLRLQQFVPIASQVFTVSSGLDRRDNEAMAPVIALLG